MERKYNGIHNLINSVDNVSDNGTNTLTHIVIVNKPGYPIPYVGGIERYSIELAKNLAKKGLKITLVSSFITSSHEIKVSRLKLINASLPLQRLAKEGSIKWLIHHVSGSLSYAITAFSHIIKSNSIIVHVNDGFTALILHVLKIITGKKYSIIVSVHAPPPWEMNYGKHPTLIKIAYILLYISGMLTSNQVIAVNPIICESIKQIKNKCIFIPNGLPQDIITSRLNESSASDIIKSYGINKEYFLFVGRLVPEKGINKLLKIAYEYKYRYKGKDAIIVIGKGSLEGLVKKASMLIKDLYYLGFVPRDHLKAFYLKAKALLITSTVEGMPTVILEAIAHGTPVIAIKFRGIEEIQKHLGCNALIITENPNQITRVMMNLLEQEKMLDEIMKKIVNEYNWGNIATIIIKEYRKLIGMNKILERRFK
ncbi:MAG: glycosyltransferase family 4 protein [Desulfurococcales archaeon]|nr:glycosyltransferase family 4 protein [Desulfurococcales archaeon]